MTWRLLAKGRFYDAGEGPVVYYDPRSGDTHLLSAFAAFILQELAQRPLDIGELAARASLHIDSGDPGELDTAIHAVLGDLLRLDLLQHE